MFTKVLVFSSLLAAALSAAVNEPIAIVSQNADIHPDGSYAWNFESADGVRQEQSGTVKQVGKDETASAIQGTVSWTDPEGHSHQYTYVADENGYQPQGADIPVAPEIPAQIARALEWIAAHPEPEEKHH